MKKQDEIAYKKQQKEIADMEDFIARNKARVATRNMASSRQKKLDKMDILSKPKEKIKPVFSFEEARTPGKVLFDCQDLIIGYDMPLTKPMNLTFERNRKVAIKGVNGLGKTTLLKTLIGMLEPYDGIVEKDPFVEIGFFKQEEASENKTTLNYLWDQFPSKNNGEIRSMLAKCGLTTDHIESLMKVLSGGENAKARLCAIMNKPANVLVLDEPTNHLDVDAKEALQTALKAYRGAIILVSHDPEFYLMTHPNNLLFRQSFENRRIRLNRNLCSSIFLCFTSLHTSAIHKMCHLHTITDTKNRNTGFKNCRIAFKRFLIIYTVWSTRENDSPDILQCQNFFQCHRVRVQFRINTKLTNTTCYQLVILTSEVKYDNFISHECILLIKKPIP